MRCCGPSMDQPQGWAGPWQGLKAPQSCPQKPRSPQQWGPSRCWVVLLLLRPIPSIPFCNPQKLQVFWREEVRKHQGGAVPPIPHCELEFVVFLLSFVPGLMSQLSSRASPCGQGWADPCLSSPHLHSSGNPCSTPSRGWLGGEQVLLS